MLIKSRPIIKLVKNIGIFIKINKYIKHRLETYALIQYSKFNASLTIAMIKEKIKFF